jgi:hypothetical protein
MEHVALAIGFGGIVIGIRLGGVAEKLLPMPPPPQPEGIFNRMAGLMAQDAHAPVGIAPFDFEHLIQFKLGEPRMSEIEGNRDTGDVVRTKPFIGQPEVGTKAKATALQFLVQLRNAIFEAAARDLQIEVAQP